MRAVFLTGNDFVIVSAPVARAVFLAACVLLGSQSASAEEWPRWGGQRGDGTWQGPKLPDKWPAGPLPVHWKQSIGGGYGGISVADGRAYVMDRQVTPLEQERVLCFDAASGRPLWTHTYPVAYGKLDYGNGPRATPTVFDGRVYTLGAVGHFFCLDAATGKALWSKNFVADFGATLPMWGLAASPVVWEDLVFVHPGAKHGCMMAFDRITGREAWRVSDDPAGYSTPVVVQAPSGPQLVCWTPEHVLGISPRSGKLDWSIPYKVNYGVSIATPIFHQGIVFVTGYWEGSKAIRLGNQPADATLVWEDTRQLRGLLEPPLYRDGYAYTIDRNHGLTCFEYETGKKIWDDPNHEITARGNNPHASLVWLGDGDRALILNESGKLMLAHLNPRGFSLEIGPTIISPAEDKPIWAHMACAGSRVYARNDREIVCVGLPGE